MINLFHLENVKNLYPREISGGQQQRVALARMLVSELKILLLDEPFSALDSHLRWKVEQEITSVLAEFRGTTILVSHDCGEAYRISNKIAVMSRGKIESIGAKKDIFGSPRTLAAALITGCKNVSKAKKLGENQVEAIDWGITLKTKNSVHDNVKYIAVRAHHFQQVGLASGKNNIFQCFIHRIIEEPFKKIVIFSFGSNTESNERLQFTIQSEDGGKLDLGKFFLAIPENKILCLES